MIDSESTDSISSFEGSDQPQQFEVCVNILEAKKLMWKHKRFMSSFVVLKLLKQKRKTTVKKNNEEPVFGEYFVFQYFGCFRDMMTSTLEINMMQKRRIGPAALLGKHGVDLSAVWMQQNHQLMQKWLQLSAPNKTTATGYLKVDVWIVTQDIERKIFKQRIMERTILDLEDTQRANYAITIYQIENMPVASELLHPTKTPKIIQNMTLPKTFVRVLFSGLKGETKVQKNTLSPKFNEEISLIESFPNVNDIVRTDVCLNEIGGARVFGSFILRISRISHGGSDGFLPTFGPWPIHLYGNVGGQQTCLSDNGPFYKGTITMELQSAVPYTQRPIRTVMVTPVSPLNEDQFGPKENYLITCVLTEISMIDPQLADQKCKLAISYGDLPNILESKDKNQNLTEDEKRVNQIIDSINQKKAYETSALPIYHTGTCNSHFGYCNLDPKFTILQLLVSLPNFKRTMYIENLQKELIHKLKFSLKNIEDKLTTNDYKNFKELNGELLKTNNILRRDIKKLIHLLGNELKAKSNLSNLHVKVMQRLKKQYKSIMPKILSTGHRNWFEMCKETENEQYHTFEEVKKKNVKQKVGKTKQVIELLSELDYDIPTGWPDLVIWLINGNTKVAYSKLNSRDIIHSHIGGLGKKSSTFNSILMKPVKCPKHLKNPESGCFCIGAKLEVYPSLTSITHKRGKNMYNIPDGFKVDSIESDVITHLVTANTDVECVAYVYRAKLNGGNDVYGLANPFVLVHAFNACNRTQIMCQDLTPIWNQVVRIKATAARSEQYLQKNKSIVFLEVYHCGYGKENHSLIGRTQVASKFETNRQNFPELSWHSLYKGMENVGQILMSAAILEKDDTVPYDPNIVENLPEKLIPETISYKLDIYWWGLREMGKKAKTSAYLDMEDLSIKSSSIINFKSNSNFKNGRASETFKAPLKEKYCPPMSIRLFGKSSYGRSVYLGTNILKNPNKYIIEWIPEAKRKKAIASFKLDSFRKTDRGVPVKTTAASKSTSKWPRFSLCWFLEKIKRCVKKILKFFQRAKPEPKFKQSYTIMPIFHKTQKASKTRNSRKIRTNKKANTTRVEDAKDTILQVKNNWWIRFYSSLDDVNIYHAGFPPDQKLKIFNSELESQPGFEKLKDWCYTMKMYQGKKTGIPAKDRKLQRGALKAGIAIYKWPPPEKTIAVTSSGVPLEAGYYSEHPNNAKEKYRVRLYIIKGIHLMPKNFNNKARAFLKISCGKHKFGGRSKHISETLNPVFGSFYEFVAKIPRDYKLTISVSSYSASLVDSLIGSTEIDLEDRIYSKHRAFCGIPFKYSLDGTNRWRNIQTPSEILASLCVQNHLKEPQMFRDGSVMFNGHKYLEYFKDPNVQSTIKRESTCLRILRQWYKIPICGYRLVPEHVETRSLYHPNKPGMEQGKIMMFLEVFPFTLGAIPPPLDIKAEKPEKYEVRVIVWNVNHVKLGGYNFLAGQKATDIYVTAWIGDSSKAQATDVHYRSTTGEGNFNWRMVFDISYLFCEQKIVEKISILDIDTEPEHLDPILVVQVMDKDTFTLDDFLGSLNLNLSRMPFGTLAEKHCSLKSFKSLKQTMNLFNRTNTRGWWPFQYVDPISGSEQSAGKVELEIQIVKKEKAKGDPVGLGRSAPSPLPEPIRPETAYNALMNPLRGVKQLFRVQGSIFSASLILIVLAVTFFVFGYMALPQVLLDKIIGKILH